MVSHSANTQNNLSATAAGTFTMAEDLTVTRIGYGARHGATASQIALAIPGTDSLAHLEENIAAGSLTLAPEDLADLDSTGEEL